MDTTLRQWLSQQTQHATGDIQRVVALPVEASHRQFSRIETNAESLIAMASPPHLENNDQFEALSECFRAAGVNVPEILAHDRSSGFFLMTDVGNTHLADVYEHSADDALSLALQALIKLAAVNDPVIPAYTQERFKDELELFDTWFVQRWLEQPAAEECRGAFAACLAAIAEQPTVCVHRDYHCRNLLIGCDGELGIVDFQDALMGPLAYDPASLLRDCYHRFAEQEIDYWRDAYLASTGLSIDSRVFERWLDLTAAQRQLKALGIFVRLDLRDGKRSHLTNVMPVVEHLRFLARKHSELAPVGDLLYRLTPAIRRRLSA
ncbi:MAG: phosphotransferase [Pseudomonadaceae bacterium]|nr:phosphotransferase [Pseudomonadaceae bacterium]